MLMMSHYELPDDELASWHCSLSESHRIARVRHELIAAMRYDQLRCLASALWGCLIVFEATNENFQGLQCFELFILAFKKIVASLILVAKI